MDGSGLRRSRLTLRLSQTDLAEALNTKLGRSYDKPRVSRWENKHEPVPDDVAAVVEGLAALQPGAARVVVFANQKGGVGKTTSALNVACGLARLGRRVLLVDMDPQATATVAILADAAVAVHRDGRTMAQVILKGRSLQEAVLRAADAPDGRALPFDLAASHIDLAETDGRREPGFDAALREALDGVRGDYDWVVVDAPPNLGMLTWMALAAADECIVPVRTEPYDAMGVGLILGTINKVQRRLNPALRLAGILPTQYGARKLVDREVLGHLTSALGATAPVLDPVPDSAVFGHAARNGRIALEAYPASGATGVYSRLARALSQGDPLPTAEPLRPLREA